MGDSPVTFTHADFAGRRRKFELRLGEVEELERLCCANSDTGVGAIMVRLASHQFKVADVRDTIRLGLVGGGLDETAAEALLRRHVDGRPLAQHMGLAMQIVEAFVNGLPNELKKNSEADGAGEDKPAAAPETSPSSIASAE
jgi:hypothetical protein